MHILGISSLEHDPAAALLGEKGIAAAVEEGKLLRTRMSYGIPRQAVYFCLAKARIQWKDLSSIAIASPRYGPGAGRRHFALARRSRRRFPAVITKRRR